MIASMRVFMKLLLAGLLVSGIMKRKNNICLSNEPPKRNISQSFHGF